MAETPVEFDKRFFHKLPKTDLHVHLDGSMRLETILSLAKQDNIDLGTTDKEALAEKIGAGKKHDSLEDYLMGFAITLKVLQIKPVPWLNL